MRIDRYQETAPAKVLLLGNSGAGKTSALFGLVRAGYKLRILDLDQKLRPLAALIRTYRPELAPLVDAVSFGEEYRTVGGEVRFAARPRTWEGVLAMLDHWVSDEGDLGSVRSWGPDTVLVVDSLWPLGQAALDCVMASTSRGEAFGAAYGEAYQRLERLLERLRSNDDTPCHVVVTAHMQMQETQEQGAKMLPVVIGKQFAPRLGRSFDILLHAEARPELERAWAPNGEGGPGVQASQRVIWTVPTPLVDTKVPALGLPPALPNEVALPLVFERVRGVPGPGGSVEGVAQGLLAQLPYLTPSSNTVVRQAPQGPYKR